MTSPLVESSSQSGRPAEENTSILSSSTPRNESTDQSDKHDARPAAVGQESQEQDGQSEQSPLLSPASVGEHDGFMGAEPVPEDEFQKTKSLWYLFILTVSIGGLQIAWSVELSNGSPYLLSLGLSKSLMALVWIAGPLSGTLVQPYVGMLSDNCRLRWGKRKPFMVVGALATIVSLMFLAWTKEMVTGLLGLFGADPKSDGVKITVITVAVIWVYILDFAINTGTPGPSPCGGRSRRIFANLAPPFSPSGDSCIHRGLRPCAPARLVTMIQMRWKI